MGAVVFEELDSLDPLSEKFAVSVVDLLLSTSIETGASDLHIHPRGDGWDILFRIDGVLSQPHFLKGGGANDPVTRLMVLAGLPTYRSNEPMEGRVVWDQLGNDDLSMRLGVYPTIHGPRGVIRFLRRADKFSSIDSLGLPDPVRDQLAGLCKQTEGAVFLSGPTGSGKTTTMYAMLRRIAESRPRRSVMTIEDPVECLIDTISQSELDPSGGMTLAAALRSAVRQDCEVLLVSEIRDPETAEAAFQASLTGHLVFSSIHASDVAASIRRLAQFGLPLHVIQSGVRSIVCQRLLRKICQACEKQDPNCTQCMGTGYSGRKPIAECVSLEGSDPVGEAMMDVFQSGGSLQLMREAAAKSGGLSLRDRANQLVVRGETDDEEVFRVLGNMA